MIRKQGGIPFVKSNNPQLTYVFETFSKVYGLSANPHNPNRSCAGSSGGEGGLVAARCSPLGMGTDIGGSIRGPAAFTGVYGFKPTPARSSYSGVILPVEDGVCPQTQLMPATGPIAPSANSLKSALETLFDSN